MLAEARPYSFIIPPPYLAVNNDDENEWKLIDEKLNDTYNENNENSDDNDDDAVQKRIVLFIYIYIFIYISRNPLFLYLFVYYFFHVLMVNFVFVLF